MSTCDSTLPGDRDARLYRPNVGIALFSRVGLVFIGRRADSAKSTSWQMPQGGIDSGEAPLEAAYRELAEETGVRREHTKYLGETPCWHYYDFPPEIKARLGGPYRGQRQRWFALSFCGTADDIVLDGEDPAEFDAWKWAHLADVVAMAVPFKRAVYQTVSTSFARYSAGCDGASASDRAMA